MPQSRMEVRQLRAFVTLVETGRVTATAEALGLAQSTVSEALAALERAVGAQLIVRGRGNQDARLTAAGEALLPHARAILAAVDSAQLAVAGAANEAHGAVRIVANESVSTYVLPTALAELRGRWPATEFSVSVATCPGIREGVSRGEFEVGVLLEAPDRSARSDPDSTERHVIAAQVPLLLFARPMHPLLRAPNGRVRRAELAPYPFFVSDASGDFHLLVQRFFKSEGIAPKIEATGTVEGVKRAVISGTDAIGLLPGYAVAEELRHGTLQRVEVQPALPRVRCCVLLSRLRERHPAIAALVEALERAEAPERSAR